MPSTKCQSMMNVQRPAALGNTALGTRGSGQPGREEGDEVATGHEGVRLVLGVKGERQMTCAFGKRALMLEMDIGHGKA